MISRKLALRLVLDLTAAALLLVGLAYYWLDNATHEFAGTAMFALLFAHNVLNRRWYAGLPKRQETRRTLDKMLVLCLLTTMGALLVTSVMVSQTVFAAVASPEAFTARRIHALAAYWAFVLMAVHVGIRWPVIVAGVRGLAGVRIPRIPPALPRLVAAGIALAGIYSCIEIGIAGKLLARMSLDGWDFSESTPSFFLHHLAIVGLLAWLSHQVFRRIRLGRT